MASAQTIIDFIQRFCISHKGRWANKPLSLIPWQKDLLYKLCDTRREDGLRQYKECNCFLPRRNGKTTFLSALCLALLVVDAEPGAEIYIVSNTLKQASENLFDQIHHFIKNYKPFSQFLEVQRSRYRIFNHKTNSKLLVLSSDQQLGQDASVIVFDEIAFFKNRKTYTGLRASVLNRPNHLIFTISTMSDLTEGIGHEIYEAAVRARDDPQSDPTRLPIIYEAPEALPWDSEEALRVANPSLTYNLDIADLITMREAARLEPRKKAEYQQFHLNRWQFGATSWIDLQVWMKGRSPYPADLRDCVIGLDTSRCDDLTCACYVFKVGEDYWLKPHFYMPTKLIQDKEKIDGFPYSAYPDEITFTPGNVTDYGYIRRDIQQSPYKIKEIAYDPNGSTELLCNQQLRQEDGFSCVPVKPTIASMSAICKHWERLLLEGRIKHDSRVLDWNAKNITVRTDSYGNICPEKGEGRGGKVDGIIAAVLGMSRMLYDPGELPFFVSK